MAMKHWWELCGDEQVGETHLDDFFCDHLHILEGIGELLLDLYHNSECRENNDQISLAAITVLTLSRTVERAVQDLRERITLADRQARALLAKIAKLEKTDGAGVAPQAVGREVPQGRKDDRTNGRTRSPRILDGAGKQKDAPPEQTDRG